MKHKTSDLFNCAHWPDPRVQSTCCQAAASCWRALSHWPDPRVLSTCYQAAESCWRALSPPPSRGDCASGQNPPGRSRGWPPWSSPCRTVAALTADVPAPAQQYKQLKYPFTDLNILLLYFFKEDLPVSCLFFTLKRCKNFVRNSYLRCQIICYNPLKWQCHEIV